MSTSDKKVAANRINGQKSHGPKDTTSTRYNATKHSLLALGITELDNKQEYETTLDDLIRGYSPIGAVEIFLVRSAALDMVRWRRARRLEAEYITAVLNPPLHEKDPIGELTASFQGPVLDPGIPASISAGSVQSLVSTFQRYESSFANRLFRTLHELERLQRMRHGEHLPPPIPVDVSVPADVLPSDSKSAQSPVTLDVLHTDHEVAEPLAEVRQEKLLLPDDENLAASADVDVTNGESGKAAPSPVTLDALHADHEVAEAPAVVRQEKRLLPDDENLAAPADVDVSNCESGKVVGPAPWRPRRSVPIWSKR